VAKLTVVHVVNQFYGGVGGEAHADMPFEIREGAVGPGREIARRLGDAGTIVATVVFGENWAHANPGAVDEVVAALRGLGPDAVLLGPAFGSGRYGITCARIAVAARTALKLRAVITAMQPENPGVDICRRQAIVVRTSETATGMREAVDRMVALLLRAAAGEPLGEPDVTGYIGRGLKRNIAHHESGAERAIGMLQAKMAGQRFATEIALPRFVSVAPAPPIRDARTATLAMVTTGGVVPRGNPDRIESRFATKWGRYRIEGLDSAVADDWEDVHGGFDNHFMNEDPNRVLPLDVLRELEGKEFGVLAPDVISTVGNMMAMDRAEQFGRDIAAVLLSSRIDGVIFAVT
jgi:glycine reductase